MKGRIFDVKRFALHDGDGIRTTVFFKGCSLRCPWCQNPEGLWPSIEIWRVQNRCIACGLCASVCGSGAIGTSPPFAIDHEVCTCCGDCLGACSSCALAPTGRDVSVDEIVQIVLRDRVFFGKNGGATLSGGEVLLQPDFACALLMQLKREGVDTAIETSLYASADVLARFFGPVDHFLVDIKLMDPAEHLRITGVSNEPILRNYQALVRAGRDVLVRVPLIPGYTVSEENLRAIARFVRTTDPEAKVELLNYNPLGQGKYGALGQHCTVQGAPFSIGEMDVFNDLLRQEGVQHIIRE